MACRKPAPRDDRKNRNPSAAVSDALLFATMCIIGMPVEVHAIDGSVYSGIFHTASAHNQYAVVLKKARLVKKGSRDSNVREGCLVETLVVKAKDLVQVIAKDATYPSDGMAGFLGNGEIGAIGSNGRDESLEKEENVVKPNGSKVNKKKNNSRHFPRKENGFVDSSAVNASNAMAIQKAEHNGRLKTTQSRMIEVRNTPDDRRKSGNGSIGIQNDNRIRAEVRDERTMLEVQGSNVNGAGRKTQSTAAVNIPVEKNVRELPMVSSTAAVKIPVEKNVRELPMVSSTAAVKIPVEKNVRELPMVSSGCSTSLVQRFHESSISDKPSHVPTSTTDTSLSAIPVSNANSTSGLSASSNSFSPIPTKNSSIKRTTQESKLNPGAKMFSPSALRQKPGTPPPVLKGASVTYIPDTRTMVPITAEREADTISFSRSSLPVKSVPCNNVDSGNGGNDYAPYVQHITGHVVSRTQPTRYAGQYNNIQTMPTYIQPNPQNVMHGRANPLVYMHPVSSDFVRSETVFSPSAPRPLLNPHPMHLPKYQGNASPQALQLYMTPPVIANGAQAQPFIMTSPHPISQPLIPVVRAVPGSNMYPGTKFA